MADPLGVPKPGDVFIGVIDFFAIVMPGVAAALLVGWRLIEHAPEAVFWVTLLVAGFVLGHVLNGLGSFLDVLLYDPFFKPAEPGRDKKPFATGKYFRANDELYRLALQLSIRANASQGQDSGRETKSPPGGMFQWARTWLRLRSPEATAQLDRLEADSKLLQFSCSCHRRAGGMAFGSTFRGSLWLAFAGLVVFLWRYCDLRQKMVRSCYLQYVQLRSESDKVTSHAAP